jgi:hypothetical protein
MGIVRVILLRASLLALIGPPCRDVLVSKMPGITATVGRSAVAIIAGATGSRGPCRRAVMKRPIRRAHQFRVSTPCFADSPTAIVSLSTPASYDVRFAERGR